MRTFVFIINELSFVERLMYSIWFFYVHVSTFILCIYKNKSHPGVFHHNCVILFTESTLTTLDYKGERKFVCHAFTLYTYTRSYEK